MAEINARGWRVIYRKKFRWKFSKRYDWSFSFADGFIRTDLKKPNVQGDK